MDGTAGWTRPQATAALVGAPVAAKGIGRRPPTLPTKHRGFLWGTAISANQSEGNNVGTDAWLLET